MFTQAFYRFISKLALFAVVFASLAPAVSHALAAHTGDKSFVQSFCTTDGKQISIQVTTTLGKQLVTDLSKKQTTPQPNIHAGLEHCPFCANPAFNADLASPTAYIIAKLETEAKAEAIQFIAIYVAPNHLTPPAQAPPILL